eukprot:5422532-Pyramimonas_sp.AAC.1
MVSRLASRFHPRPRFLTASTEFDRGRATSPTEGDALRSATYSTPRILNSLLTRLNPRLAL